jgi:hypothetical protein
MRHHLDRARPPARNWGLLLMLVLCVEFWIFVTNAISHSI